MRSPIALVTLLTVVATALTIANPDTAGAVTQYKQVSGNSETSCGLVSDDTVKCWGFNGNGTLGTPYASLSQSTVPVSVSGVSGATQVSVGGSHACARLSAGSVSCWGYNPRWELGFRQECKLDQYGVPFATCYEQWQCDCVHGPAEVAGVTGAVEVSSGATHACALISGGSVTCWGNNWHGEVGDGSGRPYPVMRYFWDPRLPVQVVDLYGATQISAGGEATCARLSSGQIKCWGSNYNGQLGNGTKNSNSNSTPTTVLGISSATQVTQAGSNACAVLADGSVRCWGLGEGGALGNGSTADSPVPVTVTGITNAKQVVNAYDGFCARLSTGRVKCWGYNSNGAVGDGTTTTRTTPVPVPGLWNVTSLADHAPCARLSGGGVRCWGDNRWGQVGDATTTPRLSPVPVHDTPTADSDTDGDGLPDGWENEPVDLTGDGKPDLDLPAMGAEPEHKDLFVELDAMPHLRLAQGAIDAVTKSFGDAPVSNPDGTTGIRLHVDNGPSSVMNPVTGETWGAASRAGEIPYARVTGSNAGSDYNWAAFDAIKAANFDPLRARAFRYAISVNRFGSQTEGSSGLARGFGATDLIVSLGHVCRPEGRCLNGELAQAGTFMHELGHTLGLRHGGSDDLNNKPNYLSVMNYLFQFTGPLRRSNRPGSGPVDYSRFSGTDMPTLDENALVEFPAFSTSDKVSDYSTFYWAGGRWRLQQDLDRAADFNHDGRQDGAVPVKANINGDSDFNSLQSFSDWPNLIYRAGAMGLGAGQQAPAPPATTVNDEPAVDLLQRFADLTSAPPLIKTGSTTSIAQAGARLNGTVNPSGQKTEVQFEYGTTADNVQFTPWVGAGNGAKTVPFNRSITGLVGDTTYTVRAVARTGTQIVFGAEVRFRTAPCSRLSTRARRQACVLAREQFNCNQLTDAAKRTTCLRNAPVIANRTR